MVIDSDKDLDHIFQESLKAFNESESSSRDERMQCLQDRRFTFIAGAQWEGKIGDQFEKRPKLEINKIQAAVVRTVNEYKNNSITVNFKSTSSKKSSDRAADICNDLYRASEQESEAQEAYDVAVEDGVSGGMGAWRLRAEYIDEYDDDNHEQRIVFEQINDADQCVFFDTGANRQDKSDATKCWIISSMPHDDFVDQYKQSPADWPKTITETEYDWATDDEVNVAEYYKVVTVDHSVFVYKNLDGSEDKYTSEDFDNDPQLKAKLSAIGSRLTKAKKTKRKRIEKYIMSGGGILDDCGLIAGDRIPVVVYYGKRNVIDGVERLSGIARTSRDSQIIKNVQASKLTEISALSTVEKPILTEEQVLGHTSMWRRDNIDNNPYLLINETEDSNGMKMPTQPISYTRVPQIPPALAALIQLTDADMRDLLGSHQAGEEIRANISGDAIQKIQDSIGMNNYLYISNFAKALKQSGRIWLGMARDIYVEEGRKLRSISKDGSESYIEIGKMIMNDDGATELEFDLRNSFDVSVDVGPSTSSKRSKTVQDIVSFMPYTDDKEDKSVLTAAAMMNIEGSGLEDTRNYFRNKLIRMGAAKPTKEEQERLDQEAQNQVPDANQEYLKAAAQAELAKAEKTQADTQLSLEKAEETKAKTVEILSSLPAV